MALLADAYYFDGVRDDYHELDILAIVNAKLHGSFSTHARFSANFRFYGELENFAAVWTAVATVWNNRHSTYKGIEADIKAAMDSALIAAGYLLY